MSADAIDANAPSAGHRAIVARLSAAQKVKTRGAPGYSIYVNRPIGRHLAAFAYRAGLTPNAVTAISACFSLAGILVLVLVPPQWWTGVLVWLALAIGYAFDSADGQLARLRGGGSLSGEWLDHVVDATKIAALHLAVLVMFFRWYPIPTGALLIPVGYSIVATVIFFTIILNEQLKRSRGWTPAASAASDSGRSTPLRALAALPMDYGFLCLAFVTAGWPVLFFWVYTAFFVANALYLAVALRKWFRDLEVLDARTR
ncbi:CDP-alcohol phosphatidyltransferase family protein [Leifsonia sp. fls2-241-R2A-40a]|uniref:CDP-alcohol phosphatidyltransferase family protein n=1 Tax=Leifsonia sp. fls2-241-R2A-40a TaxID=3040290 RepID=UPI00254BFFB1|nr:CDP-alcohol phosphatidyltransferase family protein [Leifsonia sp. fls2-241-R2A-40a]